MTTATVAGSVLPAGAEAAGSPFKPFVLILSGCDPKVDPDALFGFIDPIVSHNIPIGYAVGAEVSDSEGAAADPYLQVVREFSANLPGLVELLPDAGSLRDQIPYFLARKAFDVYGRFQAIFDPAPNQRPVSLFSQAGEGQVAGIAGVRSSGFRTVYSPFQKSGPAEVRYEPNGVLSIEGGIIVEVGGSADAFRDSLDRAVNADDFIFVNLSLAGLTGVGRDRAFELGSELAVAMARRKALGQIVPNLPRDFHLRLAGASYDRAISVCIDTTGPAGEGLGAYEEFVSSLSKQSISVTRIAASAEVAPEGDDGDAAAGAVKNETCPVLGAPSFLTAASLSAPDFVRPKCAALTSRGTQESGDAFALGLSTLLDLSNDAQPASGLDDSGVLRIPEAVSIPGPSKEAPLAITGKLPELLGHHRDAIIVISAGSLATESGRNLILRELSDLAAQPWSTFRSLQGFSNAVVPDFNHLELIRQSKFDRYLESRQKQNGGDRDRERLMGHARLAWQYFAKETHERSGFTPATIFRSEDFKSNYEVITMWDVTSHLNGTLCAAELGIIPREEMVERVKRILGNLPSRKITGLKLPVAEFHFASGSVVTEDYNSCDVGRLLVCLHLLSRVPELKDTATRLVEGWDLDQTVQQGKIMDISRRRFVDASRTNCSHYAGLGYRLWGIEAESPYSTPDGEGAFDKGIRLLNAVGNIGPIGAEPLLLEGVELGFTPESQILADVLYSAQFAEFRRSGDLVAVSETPLDREPWFIYQGLDVNDAEDPWKLFSIMDEARFRTAGFTYANRMLSTKAAFLWDAVRPGAFSDKLLERAVRDTVLPELGFAVGIYKSTDQPTFGYSGMNTNGIILESVAYALRGGRPMNQVEF